MSTPIQPRIDVEVLERVVVRAIDKSPDDVTVSDLARAMGVSRNTIYRARRDGGYPLFSADQILTRLSLHLTDLEHS